MAAIERTAYPRFKKSISQKDLVQIYTPTLEEIEVAHKAAKGVIQVLNYLLLLKSFQRLGYFPKIDEIPIEIGKMVPATALKNLSIAIETICSYVLYLAP